MSYFAPYIDETGLHMPTYEERLEELMTAYRQIFGEEIVLDPAVPDYQLLSVFARALDDTSALVLDDYNSRNPGYATGTGLDLAAQQYGISRFSGETDAQLRIRIGAAMASKGCASAETLLAALKSLRYVRDAAVYVNDGDSADDNGIPGHSIACVVYSGLPAEIREVIWKKNAPGIGTYGSSSGNYTDSDGNEHTVSYSAPSSTQVDSDGNEHTVSYSAPSSTQVTIVVKVRTLKSDFVLADQEDTLRTAIVAFVQALGIGKPLIISQLYGVCYSAVPESLRTSFMVTDILSSAAGQAHGDLYPCAWNGRLTTMANLVSFEAVT